MSRLFGLNADCSITKLCLDSATPWTAVHQAPLSSNVSQSLLKFMSIELLTLSNQFNLSQHQSLFQ